MPLDAYSILIALSVLVVLSYLFNYIARKIKIPAVLLLLGSGVALRLAADAFHFDLPLPPTLLETLGVAGLIFIVLEASLELIIQPGKLRLMGLAFASAFGLVALTSGFVAFIFIKFFDAGLRQALLHAIPLSVISSAIAIPSVQDLPHVKKEFIVYESTFSDIIGIIFFNNVVRFESFELTTVVSFTGSLFVIAVISVLSTAALLLLLSRFKAHVRFILTFAILIIVYSFAKYFHLPALLMVMFFGVALNNFRLFEPWSRGYFSAEKLSVATKELHLMTSETAFIIRTFFFLAFGYSFDLSLIASSDVLILGLSILGLTVLLRYIFLRVILPTSSLALALIAPRGLISVLLFYSIPTNERLHSLSEGMLFTVIVLTSIAMTIGLLVSRKHLPEKMERLG